MRLKKSFQSARVRLKPIKWTKCFTIGILLVFLSLHASLAQDSYEATDERDARKVTDDHTGQVVGLHDYNAQLLEELKNPKISPEVGDGGIDDGFGVDGVEEDEGEEERVIGSSVATSASSAISFSDVTTTPMPQKFDEKPSAGSEDEDHDDMEDVLEGKVDPKDPYLEAVFPHYAAEYSADSSNVESSTDTSDLSFVDDYDFALLNEKGEIEMRGTAEQLGNAVGKWKNESEVNDGDDDVDEVVDLNDLNGQEGPTTLMLFNIFTPDEVDFLSTLIGDDALKEIQKDVDTEISSGLHPGLNMQTATSSPPLSRRPPQFYDPQAEEQDPKNVNPSFSGTGPQASSIRESLQVYHREDQVEEQESNFPGEEGKLVYASINRTNVFQAVPDKEELYKTVEVRQQKVEEILNRLSTKYDEARANLTKSPSLEGQAVTGGQQNLENNDRMKVMIENLKQKLATSRPGINSLQISDLSEVSSVTTEPGKLFHTTPAPVAVQDVEGMIGEKIRGLSVGVHRLNLDEILDMDKLNVAKKVPDAKESSSEKVATKNEEKVKEEDKSLPKRDVHPKLTFQRPELDIVHRPSAKLKDFITPGADASVPVFREQPTTISHFYEQQGIPIKDFPKSFQSQLSQVQPPPTSPPSIPGSLSDPYPLTKELPPYHKPIAKYPQPPPEDKKIKQLHEHHNRPPPGGRPEQPPLFYNSPPPPPATTFKNKIGPYFSPSERLPEAQALHQPVVSHGLPENKPQYVPSSSYRLPSPSPAPGLHPSTLAPLHHGSTPTPAYQATSLAPSQHSPSLPLKHQYSVPGYEMKQPNLRFDSDPNKQFIQVTPKNIPPVATTPAPATPVPTYSTPYQTLPDDKIKSLGYRPKSSSLPQRLYTPATRPTIASNPHVSTLSPLPNKYQASLKQSTTVAPVPIDYSAPVPTYPSSSKQSALPYVSSLALPTDDYQQPKIGKMLDPLKPPSKDYLPPSDHLSSMQLPSASYVPPTGYQSPVYSSAYLPPSQDYAAPEKPDLPQPTYIPQYLSNYTAPVYLPAGVHQQIETYSHGNSGHMDEKMISSSYQPPTDSYLPPAAYDENSHMKPPSEDYLVPITSYISAMAPPFKGFFTSMLHQFTKLNPPSGNLTPDVDTQHYKDLSLPNQDYLPPPPPTSYVSTMAPPVDDYRSPKKFGLPMAPPTSDYNVPAHSTLATPPSKEYLPPSGDTRVSSILPPSKDYIALPQYSTIEPPRNEYLPPDTYHKNAYSMTPPKEDYKAPAPSYDQKLLPPTQGYLPPASANLGAKIQPPVNDYLPPPAYGANLTPPGSGYLPPTSTGASTIQPPSKDYLPPSYDSKLSPPNQGYLPPKSSGGSVIQPPTQEYIPSNFMSTIEPPTHQYLPPSRTTAVPYNPPSKEYLPPSNPYQSTMKPPQYEYSQAPKGYMSTILPPTVDYTAIEYKEKLTPPGVDYLPPDHSDQGTYMLPPVNDYKAPAEITFVVAPDQSYYVTHMEAPSKNYSVPETGYYLKHHLPPNYAFLSPGQEHFVLRNKDSYNPEPYSSKRILDDSPELEQGQNNGRDEDFPGQPRTLFNTPSGNYLPPSRDKEKDTPMLGAHLELPKSEYLPPSPKVRTNSSFLQHDLPSKEYLPPPASKEKASKYHSDELLTSDESIVKYHPPQNEYLPPKNNASGAVHIHLPTKSYLPPSYDHVDYSPPSGDYSAPHSHPKVAGVHPPITEYREPLEKSGGTYYNPPIFGYTNPERKLKTQDMEPPELEFAAPTKEGKTLMDPPHKSYFPPSTDIKGLKYRPPVKDFRHPGSELAGLHYKPPTNVYIPPKEGIHGEGYQPPHKEHEESHEYSGVKYLPPRHNFKAPEKHDESYKPPSSEYVAPHEKMMGGKMTPPSKEYSQPDKDLVGSDYHPPEREYLPPEKKPYGEGYKPPVHEYSHEHGETLHPPEAHYEEPKEGGRAIKYVPPSKDYAVPIGSDQGSHYKPPEKEYYSSDKPSGDKYHPPSKEYLPPKDRMEGEHYKPPAAEYLPPKEDYKNSAYKPPEKEYLPPKDRMEGEHYKPPAAEYLPPKEDYKNSAYKPPEKEYLPPKDRMEGEHYKPPAKEYLPPKDDKKHYDPPAKEYHPPQEKLGGEHYQPPAKEYLPPKEEHVSYSPPEKEYLPPKEGLSGDHYEPPKKEYIPPAEDSKQIHYSPPEKEYLPPKVAHSSDSNSYKPPDREYFPPTAGLSSGEHYQPPAKEYLPPKPALAGEHYTPPAKEYLPPAEEHISLKDLAEAPTKVPPNLLPKEESYHPPTKEYQPSGTHLLNEPIQPPNHEYLPPEPTSYPALSLPQKEYLTTSEIASGVHYNPPKSEYIPPPADDHMTKLHPPSKSYLPPDGPPLPSIGVTINGKPEVHSHVVETAGAPGGLPHAINIHINMPHAEHEVKETVTHHHENGVHETHTTTHHETHPVPIFNLGYPDKDTLPPHVPPPPHPDNVPNVPDPLLVSDHQVIMPHLFRYDSKDEFLKHLEAINGDSKPTELPAYVPLSALAAASAAADKIMPNLFLRPQDKNTPADYQQPLVGQMNNYQMGNMPKYLTTQSAGPQKEYLPVKHHMAPKLYQPVNSYVDPGYDLKLPEYVKLPDQTLVPPASNFHSLTNLDIKNPDYPSVKPLPDLPKDSYIHPPPSSSYLPPSEAYKPPSDYLPPLSDLEDELDDLLNADLKLKIPSRGPQFPVKDEFKLSNDYLAPEGNKSKYKEPPPRPLSQDLEAPSVLNSQNVPPSSFEDKYIPPKTKFDVPKNFKRPGGAVDLLDADLPEPPSPSEIASDIDDGFDAVEEFQQISEPAGPKAFLGLAKLKKPESGGKEKEKEEAKDAKKSAKPAKLVLKEGPQLPPMPTLPPQPDRFLPLLEQLKPTLLQQLQQSLNREQQQQAGLSSSGDGSGGNKIPGRPGVDYPDFKVIPVTDFSCENFILEGFYADTFTSCQVFHVCESGKRQSSFLCPKGTIFNQKHRVCDWWYNVKCEESPEFYDLNLDLLLLEKGSTALGIDKTDPKNDLLNNLPPAIDPLASLGIDAGLLGDSANLLELSNMLDGLGGSEDFISKRRMDIGDDDNDDDDESVVAKPTKGVKKSKGRQQGINNEVGDLSGIANLGDLTSLLEMLTSESKNKEVAAPSDDDQPQQQQQQQQQRKKKRRNRNRNRKRNNRNNSKAGNVANQEEVSGGGYEEEVTLCQLMNICDKMPNPTEEQPIRPDHPRSNIPFAAASTVQEFVVEAPAPNTSASSSSPGRVGEKTASEIAEIYARSNGFSDIFSADIGADEDSETSNSDKMVSVSNRGQDFGEIDFSSGKSIDQFDMSKTRTSDRNHAGWKEHGPAHRIPVSSINFEFDNSKERSPKMIDSNSDKSNISDKFEKPASSDEKQRDSKTENKAEIKTEKEDKKLENNTERTNVESPNFDQKIDTSLFDLSDDNFDTDAMTWRPLRLTPNGVFKTDVSEVLSTSNGDGETIVTVLSSDSWIPNGGPIMSERD